MQNFTPRLFLVVGNPASGKDELISAVNIIGSLHAEIVPKHTDRKWRAGDDDEMICATKPDPANPNSFIRDNRYDLPHCNVVYENYGNTYGIKTADIWDKLMKGVMLVLVVSKIEALNQLKNIFGDIAVTLYIYSPVTRDEYINNEKDKQERKKQETPGYIIDTDYIDSREKNFDMSWNIYVDNFMLFDHVLIYANKQEDLFDQIFRLFKAYEKGLIR
jgi:ribose 1,5-bisphosphokinase PhnN